MSSNTTTSGNDLDREALRARYREERDKRLRHDGINQYIEPTGKYAYLLDDPHVPKVDRAPIFRDVTVAFIGGGFSGLCAGARLKQAGINEGQPTRRRERLNGASYPEGPVAFFEFIEAWRTSGDFDGLEFRSVSLK